MTRTSVGTVRFQVSGNNDERVRGIADGLAPVSVYF